MCFITGESIPIRLFMNGYDLTPTMRDVNKKFSVRYYLNLVLVDDEDRRYFKQQVRACAVILRLCTVAAWFSAVILRLCGTVAAWFSGSMSVVISELTLHLAWLVLGWMTIFGQANELGM